MSVGFHEDLRALQVSQGSVDGEIRFFYDGSIWMHTITSGGDDGWYVVAPPVPRASVLIGRYFPSERREMRYLNVGDLRRAIAIRDKILAYAAEMRVRREIETDILNSN